MGLSETMLFYLLIGFAVSAAVWIAGADRPRMRLFRTVTAVPFWPLYLAILLASDDSSELTESIATTPQRDELSKMIAEVERELDGAFSSLGGWAEGVLSRERGRIGELRSAWNCQAARIREMDRVLADSHDSSPVDSKTELSVDAIQRSERARRSNYARRCQVRDQVYHDLTATLARVRELVSLIHLAKYTGEPASRAEQLVVEIAAGAEGLSEVAVWRDPLLAEPADEASSSAAVGR